MTAPINPQYPVTEVQTVDELMNIAVGMEHEAALRYDHLAEHVERRGDAELAATFRQLAELERRHEAGLGAWAQREGLHALRAKQFPWALPETFSDEDAGGDSLSPYQALGIAVHDHAD